MTKEFGICGEIGGGGVLLTMPQFTVLTMNLSVKTTSGAISNLASAAAYTAIEQVHTGGYDTATLVPVGDTTEQTVVDISGQAGVLTSIVSPAISASSATVTIRVTIDGALTTFTGVLATLGSSVLAIGGFKSTQGATTTSSTYGGTNDVGYQQDVAAILLTPNQVLEIGGVGMPFTDSLKVTVQGSSALDTTPSKAVVCFSLTIPEGL